MREAKQRGWDLTTGWRTLPHPFLRPPLLNTSRMEHQKSHFRGGTSGGSKHELRSFWTRKKKLEICTPKFQVFSKMNWKEELGYLIKGLHHSCEIYS
jgi:hypothetical protein